MELPISCRTALDDLIADGAYTTAQLRASVEKMTISYKEASGRGSRLVTGRREVLAYAASRMPATYGAVCTSLDAALAALAPGEAESLSTVLDLGAGTGAAVLAADALLPGTVRITAVEREPEMLAVGRRLTADAPVDWTLSDAAVFAKKTVEAGRTYDVVIASYMTNELSDDTRRNLLSLLWRITGKLLLLIEPGTKVGSAILRDAKAQFAACGASVCAPCPQIGDCPLNEDDWCHFTCRVARSKLHKALKGGDVPYEDEKFSYLALTRLPYHPASARVLRHPQKDAGRITLTLCTPVGREIRTVTKRDKAAFAAARKAGAGDALTVGEQPNTEEN